MKVHRFFLLVIVLALASGAQLLVGRSEQTAASSSAPTGPFDNLHFRPIGPAGMSGRITDVAVYEPDPAIFFVGSAHGGVWKTTNGGATFDPQFQDRGLMSIGDIDVSQNNPDLVWVGTGESNSRQTTSWGDGIYKSIDGGSTYTNMGLRTSRYIGRIVIDPRDNDVVFAAAQGNLWGPGGERGLYKTTDGGRTWRQVLKVDDDTGASDLVMDATSNRILYATTYQRRRSQCCMNGGGPGSGIWKSTDAGETWARMKGNGLPDGPLGRIAIDAYRRRPGILYALIQGPTPPAGRGAPGPEGAGEEPPGGGGRSAIATGVNDTPTGLYRSDNAGAAWRKVNNVNPRPMYFSQVRIDPNDPDVVIFGGVDLHMSTDGGKTVNTAAASRIHSDHHAIWIDPSNSKHVIIGNDGGLAVSRDHAKTWVFLPNLPVGLFYHVSVDNSTPYNICGGMQDNYSWCGPSAVRGSFGIANYEWKVVQGGDGFVALQDPSDSRIAFSESQDGNMVRIDRVTGETMSIRPQPLAGEPPLRWNWDTPLIMSPHDSKVLYAAANKVYRSANRGTTWETSGVDLTSNANREDIVTMGVKGSDVNISKNDGIGTWPTVVALAESPKRAGIVYAGTDDGNLQVSRDGARTWTNVMDKIPGVPKGIWVSEVVPSRFDEGVVYATFDGHRINDFKTYIYASRDYGQTWRSLAANLEGDVVKTLTEDHKNADVLYIGTETGLFVSTDRGGSWIRVTANLPTVRIDEITLHPRDNAMILATHGRAIWILDHLEPIQEYAAAQAAASDAKLFTPPPYAMFRRPGRDRNYEFWGDQTFFGENPPPAAIISWLNKRPVGSVALKITDAAGREVRQLDGPVLANSNKAGIQSVCWDLRVQPAPEPPAQRGRGQTPASDAPPEANPFGAACAGPAALGAGGGGGGGRGAAPTAGPLVIPGVYHIALVVDGKTVETKPLRVSDDPDVILTSVERKRFYDMAMEMHSLQGPITDASAAHASLTRQINGLATTLAGRNDVTADVKTAFDAVKSELSALAPKLAQPQGGRGGGGGGRGGPNETLTNKLGQAKTGFMGGMAPGEQAMRAYTEVKSQAAKTIADLNATIVKAAALSTALGRYSLTLDVPPAVKAPDVAAPKRSPVDRR